MKLRLAKKICNAPPKCRYNAYKIGRAYHVMMRYFCNYKTHKWVLRKRKLKYKDKILASNTILGEEFREYINNKQLKRKRHGNTR